MANISLAQIGLIHHLRRERGLDVDDVLTLAEEVTNTPVVSLEDLSSSEASELIDKIKSE